MTIATPTRAQRAHEFRAPLDGARSGRLVFDAGTPELALSGDPSWTDLLWARFTRIHPDIHTSTGEVVVRYPHVVPLVGWIRHSIHAPKGRVGLSVAVPWTLEFRRGATRLEADLRDVDVRSVTIESGVGHAVLRLGRPRGTVTVSMTGGVSHLEVHRPSNAPIRLTVDGSIGSMTLDDESLGAVGGRLRRESDAWALAAHRLDVSVRGGIGHLLVADLS